MCDRGGGTKWRRGWKAVQNVSFNLFPLLIADSIFSFFCFFLTSSPWGHSPYIVAPHPAMLRDTAGGEVAIWFYCCCFRCFLTPPSFGHLPYILLCITQGRRVIAKIQVCPHEFSTESYLLPDASWKLIALFLVLPVVISVIGVIAYVLIMLITSYFSRISYWISRR